MEMFTNLSWRINDVSVLDTGTDFIKDENFEKCDFWNGVQHLKRKINNPVKPAPKEPPKKKIKTTVKKLHGAIFKNINKFELPYYPQKSSLNRSQQKKSLKALQILQSNKDPKSYTQDDSQFINLYKFLGQKILKENALFQEFTEEKWKEKKGLRKMTLHDKLKNFSLHNWSEKLKIVKEYEQFFKVHSKIQIAIQKVKVETQLIQCCLELGHVAKVELLNSETQTGLNIFNIQPNQMPLPEVMKESRKPVSKDKNADKLASLYLPDIVISSSGLKTLLDNNSAHNTSNWIIPVVVKTYNVNGITKDVIFIDKPLPKRNPATSDFMYKCKKTFLNVSYCKKLGFSFGIPEIAETLGIPLNSFELLDDLYRTNHINDHCKGGKKKKKKKKSNPSKVDQINDNLIQNIPCEIPSCSKPPKDENNSDDEHQLKIIDECIDDEFIGDEFMGDEIAQTLTKIKEPSINNSYQNVVSQDSSRKLNTKQKQYNKTYHNVSYRLWNFKKTDQIAFNQITSNEIKVMIRCKINGCEEIGPELYKPLMLIPKVEYQWEYGSEIISKKELIQQWATLFFRPFAEILRFNIPSNNNQILAMDRCDVQKISNELQCHYEFASLDCLEILYKIFATTMNASAGNYILQHDPNQGSFITLLRSMENLSDPSCFDMYEYFKKENCEIEYSTTWTPINRTFILPYHLKYNFLPATFPAYFISDKGNKKKDKTKKEKKQM